MTVLQRIHYIWVRAGLVLLVAMPVAMYLMFRAQGMPDDTFRSGPQIDVIETDERIEFHPRLNANPKPWMLIPGCPADPRAYAPLVRGVALRGFFGAIIKVPYRCAPWPEHQAALRQRVLSLMETCFHCRWTLAGHSRGVRHVLELVRTLPPDRRAEVDSLVLMASTHPREDDFSDLPMRVLKILGTQDGVAPIEGSLANRALLPPSTRWEVIEGGNHAQFAYYGIQLFDGRARISREDQHRRVTDLVVFSLLDWWPHPPPSR